MVQGGEIEVLHVETADQIADIYTKPLGQFHHSRLAALTLNVPVRELERAFFPDEEEEEEIQEEAQDDEMAQDDDDERSEDDEAFEQFHEEEWDRDPDEERL